MTDSPGPLSVLRLTGEQISSIEPPVSGDWFTDWDEYEEFVPKRLYDAARTASERPPVDPLREAALAWEAAEWSMGYAGVAQRALRAALASPATPLPPTWCPTHHIYDHCEDAVLARMERESFASPAAPEACGWNTRRGDGPVGGGCILPAGHDGPHSASPAAPRPEGLDVGPDRAWLISHWVGHRCEMVGCRNTKPHEHGGGQPMRDMTPEERAQ